MKLHTKSKGFTLIEVLITLVILAVSLLALAALMGTTTKSNSYGSHITEAATFAQDKLEELRAIPWKNVPIGDTDDQKSGSTGINYVRHLEIQPEGNLKTIRITINWVDRTNHSLRMTSAMTQ